MNDLIIYGIVLLAGLAIGAILTIVITRVYKPYYRQDVLAVGGEIQKNMATFTEVATQNAVDRLVKMSGQVITGQVQVGEQSLEGKKALIDQSIKEVRDNLKSIEELVTKLDKGRAQAFGELSEQVKAAAEQTQKLSDTTGKLQAALGNTRVRGQWGERMADDILARVGFVEGINYRKQVTDIAAGGRPDYTFLLPNGLVLNMDVKFPLDNYLKYGGSEAEADREAFKADFLKDCRKRIKEVTGREYINPQTLDYVLVLVPNEQVYRFINENDPEVLDFALGLRVVPCSPVTLYAVLALINQAVRHFKTEKGLEQIIEQIKVFAQQWQKFGESMDKMGKKIQDAQKEFEALSRTRTNMLEKPLKKIEEYRREASIEELAPLELEAPHEDAPQDAASEA